jgi:hypothetical protein
MYLVLKVLFKILEIDIIVCAKLYKSVQKKEVIENDGNYTSSRYYARESCKVG